GRASTGARTTVIEASCASIYASARDAARHRPLSVCMPVRIVAVRDENYSAPPHVSRRFRAEPRPGLRRGPAWREQRTQEEVIFRILSTIPILVPPPPSAEITRLARAELGLAVRQELESALHRQRIFDHK